MRLHFHLHTFYNISDANCPLALSQKSESDGCYMMHVVLLHEVDRFHEIATLRGCTDSTWPACRSCYKCASLKCLFLTEESSIVSMVLCPMGTGPLTLQTYTIFAPTLQKVRSFYLSIYLSIYKCPFPGLLRLMLFSLGIDSRTISNVS